MRVKELMEKLSKCNPEARVCVEAYMDSAVNEVKQYIIDGKLYVYIGDDFNELEYNLGFHNEEE